MKNIMLFLLPVILVLCGCASGPSTTEYAPDKVVARSDSLDARPDWVSETVTIVNKGGKLNIIGMIEVPGDSRTQAAFKGSDVAAKGHLANKIESQLTKIVETSETGFSMEDQSLQSLIREVSEVTFHGIDIQKRYWEKVVRTKSSGEEELVLKAFSLLAVPKTEVKKMIVRSLKKAKKAPRKMRTDVAKLVQTTWETEDLAL